MPGIRPSNKTVTSERSKGAKLAERAIEDVAMVPPHRRRTRAVRPSPENQPLKSQPHVVLHSVRVHGRWKVAWGQEDHIDKSSERLSSILL